MDLCYASQVVTQYQTKIANIMAFYFTIIICNIGIPLTKIAGFAFFKISHKQIISGDCRELIVDIDPMGVADYLYKFVDS